MKLIKPYISEKTVNLAKDSKFTFIADKSITKAEAKQLVRKYYKKDVLNVKIVNKKNCRKKNARGFSLKRGYKKIIIALKDKQIIPGFEIAEESKEDKKNNK